MKPGQVMHNPALLAELQIMYKLGPSRVCCGICSNCAKGIYNLVPLFAHLDLAARALDYPVEGNHAEYWASPNKWIGSNGVRRYQFLREMIVLLGGEWES